MSNGPFPLTDSARAVFQRIVQTGRATRPVLGNALDFSKPTVSAAIAELGSLGLVHEVGIIQGATGRSATLYGLGQQAGYVIGIDAGVTQVHAIAQTLDGTVLAELEERFPVEGARLTEQTAHAVQSVFGRLRGASGIANRPLRVVSLAVPVIVSDQHPRRANGLDLVRQAVRDAGGAEIVVENNVNCAAIAELDHGAAQGRMTFGYLQVGVNIGLGLVHEGRLFRGGNGAAGEVARLPFPWIAGALPERQGLEDYLSSHALMDRVRADWTGSEAAPADARELFALAGRGVEPALRHVRRHAQDIGLLAAAVVSIQDPGLIVLGGGVGQNELLVPGVREVIERLTWPTEVVTSQLPSRGTVLGASQLAVRRAVRNLTGQEPLPLAG